MKYDTSETGWETILKDYQTALLKKLMQNLSEDPEFPGWGSAAGHKYLLQETEYGVSRASVIFCLNDMEARGMLTSVERTGKGGHHKIWSPAFKDEAALENYVVANLLQRIHDTWPRAYGEVVKVVQ